MLDPLAESKLGLIDELELRLRRERLSLGLNGFSPDWRAKRFRISVKEMTPVSRPEIRAPGRADAETAGKAADNAGDTGPDPDCGGDTTACVIDGVASGVAGVDGDGEAASTTHILWERVARSLATVWARVEYGLTWNTETV